MVVSKEKQGKGIGTSCLKSALTKADKANLPVILGTQDKKNIIFYERLGFKLVGTHTFEENEVEPLRFVSYFMVRKPLN